MRAVGKTYGHSTTDPSAIKKRIKSAPKRPNLRNLDRLLFVWLSRLVPTTLGALKVVGPETVIRWQRAGFFGPIGASNQEFQQGRSDPSRHSARGPHRI